MKCRAFTILLLLPCVVFCRPGTAAPAPGDAGELAKNLVKDLQVISGKSYQWAWLKKGTFIYTGRKHTYTEIPTALQGTLVLRTANKDRYYEAAESPFISFTARRDIKVFVLYSDYYTQLADVWLNKRSGWHKEDFVVGTSLPGAKAARLVQSKVFAAGSRVALDGNGCVLKNCSMYTVAIVPVKTQ